MPPSTEPPTHCACGRKLTLWDYQRGLNQCVVCALKEAHLPKTGSIYESVREDAKWERD